MHYDGRFSARRRAYDYDYRRRAHTYDAPFPYLPHETAGPDERGVHGPARYGFGPYYERVLRHRRPDDEVRQEVEETLFYDTWVNAEAITVEVEQGVVTLTGELPDYEEVRLAVDDAWDVEGVVGVRPQLRVVEYEYEDDD